MPADRAACRRKALDLLARREHARRELERKLGASGHDDADVAEVLDELEAEGLLADARFAESFVRARIAKGQGPLRIRFELGQRGVTEGDAVLGDVGCDWSRLARKVRARRFGEALPATLREKGRQARFLEQRGFTTAQIRDALESAEDNDL